MIIMTCSHCTPTYGFSVTHSKMGISGVPSVITSSAITTACGFNNSVYTVYLVIDR